MFTTALYRWAVAACPVDVFLEIPLADRLRVVAVGSEVEVGGFLVGRFEGDKTIVSDFELVESEHRRGTAYSLSNRDDKHLRSKLAASAKRGRQVVGFFRSHMRPGMFLDAADYHTVSDYFNNPHQVALLIRPSDDGSATGGFFFWQEGEMDRKTTSLAFPMDSAQLESGKAFDAAETLDHLPRVEHAAAPAAFVPAPVPVPVPVQAASVGPAQGGSGPSNWLKIGLIAAAAALGGYYVGTSGTGEHFGSRPGDITISDAPEPPPAHTQAPATPAAAPVQKKTVESAPPPAPATPAVSTPKPVRPAPPTRAIQHPVFDQMVRDTPPAAAPLPPITPPPPPPVEENPSAFPHNPNPVPVIPTANASVELEVVEDGGIKHAIHKVFGGGYRGGQNFQPPQVVRRITPHVSPEVARELTGEVAVDLKLKVDNTGRVSSVELVSRGSDRALVQLAGDAAYEWHFQPALFKDRPVASEVIAHFRFKPSL